MVVALVYGISVVLVVGGGGASSAVSGIDRAEGKDRVIHAGLTRNVRPGKHCLCKRRTAAGLRMSFFLMNT